MEKNEILRLKSVLEKAHKEFIKTNEILNDALAPALIYKHSADQEMAAFICSILAYGRVAQIKKSISRILDPMGDRPVLWLKGASDRKIIGITKGWKHRFNTSSDMFLMLKALQYIYQSHGTLESFISPQANDSAKDLILRFNLRVYKILRSDLEFSQIEKSFGFFLPHPGLGGACKRMNLFLKWMVRDEAPDLGIWKTFPKNKLIIPLDTHIYKQAHSLKLTNRKAADWQTAEQVTQALSYIDPKDPTKFDFALCHLGIQGKIIKITSRSTT